ncbi:MAG: class I SAM-dependent methyltransferase [Deltaproteobacteria bacterium]|nr:class I SAM-dependent methyltransferase [Deltaproteobacteria bacterium]
MVKKRKKEWFDDDSFWQDLYPFLFPEQRFADAPDQVTKVIALTNPVGKSAIDLCCGPGRCSIALAGQGFNVTGIDRTKYLLDKARAKAKADKVKIKWIQKDMRDFVRPKTFDLALSMFTSFGYFDDRQEDVQVLGNILTSLRSGGVFLIDVMSKEILAKSYHPTTSDVLEDGTKLIQCSEVFDGWTRVRNEWILIRKGRAKSFNFHISIYSGQELRDRMERVGFANVKLYGNLDGDEYGPDAQRLIAVGRKP